jgi:hypothetical protein
VENNCPFLLKFFSCPNPLVLSVFWCDELCSFGVWNVDGVCCSGLDVQTSQEDWENFLSGVNGFLNQAEANMRNCGVQAMLCPCIDCLNQKKFAQQEIIFHHLVTRGFTKNYTSTPVPRTPPQAQAAVKMKVIGARVGSRPRT